MLNGRRRRRRRRRRRIRRTGTKDHPLFPEKYIFIRTKIKKTVTDSDENHQH
jgi:hypothetical protein